MWQMFWQQAFSLVRHIDKPFECTACSKQFTTSVSLVKHSRSHSGAKPYKCHMCDKAFSQSGSLNDHTRVHTGDKPYKCSLCNKSFSRSSNLKINKREPNDDDDDDDELTNGSGCVCWKQVAVEWDHVHKPTERSSSATGHQTNCRAGQRNYTRYHRLTNDLRRNSRIWCQF